MWIIDSGVCCHYFHSVEGLTDVKEIDESVNIEYGDSMNTTKIVNLKFEVS
jgi:hypothetical protein